MASARISWLQPASPACHTGPALHCSQAARKHSIYFNQQFNCKAGAGPVPSCKHNQHRILLTFKHYSTSVTNKPAQKVKSGLLLDSTQLGKDWLFCRADSGPVEACRTAAFLVAAGKASLARLTRRPGLGLNCVSQWNRAAAVQLTGQRIFYSFLL